MTVRFRISGTPQFERFPEWDWGIDFTSLVTERIEKELAKDFIENPPDVMAMLSSSETDIDIYVSDLFGSEEWGLTIGLGELLNFGADEYEDKELKQIATLLRKFADRIDP